MFFKRSTKEFSDSEEGFVIVFPKKPKITTTQLIPTSYTKMFLYSSWGNLDQFMVGITKVNEYFGLPAEFLESALEMFCNDANATMLEQQTKSFQGNPAIFYTINVGHERNGKGMMVLVGKKIFNAVCILYKNSKDRSAKIEQFLGSFKII